MLLPLQAFTIPPTLTAIVEPKKQEPPKPITYQVKDQDTLTSIAESQHTTVQRLFNANPGITNPDQINPSDVLTIPLNTDVLVDRPFPATIQVPASSKPVSSPDSPQGYSYSGGFDTTGGWCTNYAARRHPVPAWFRNADEWLADARQAGMATGSAPQVGAIAQARSYMHVAIVEQIDGNRILVSEQNYQGYGIVSSRWTNASEWAGYIY